MEALARFAASRGAVVLVAAWSFAEAIVLPVVPDVALVLLALAAPRRAAALFAVALLASLVGSLVLFGFATADADGARALVLAVPAVQPAMLDAAVTTVAGGDPWSLAQIGPGTPLKVFTVAWATSPAVLASFVPGVVLNRLTRIGPALVVAVVLGALAPGWIRRHERAVLVAYAAVWALLYAFYVLGPTGVLVPG
jgi:membrane protein YqaA with SNARE-associated domain